MKKNYSTLINVASGLALSAVVILALQFFVFKPAKERAKAGVCYSHFKAIGLANTMYARERGTGYQTNLICFSNELISPRMLLCVDDDLRRRRVSEKVKPLEGYGSAVHWSRLTMDDCSYEVFLRDSNTFVVRCPFHKIGGYMDAQIRDGISMKREKR
jgi:hypothetical protein